MRAYQTPACPQSGYKGWWLREHGLTTHWPPDLYFDARSYEVNDELAQRITGQVVGSSIENLLDGHRSARRPPIVREESVVPKVKAALFLLMSRLLACFLGYSNRVRTNPRMELHPALHNGHR